MSHMPRIVMIKQGDIRLLEYQSQGRSGLVPSTEKEGSNRKLIVFRVIENVIRQMRQMEMEYELEKKLTQRASSHTWPILAF